MTDAGLATYKAKNKYQRTRPFVMFKVPSCTPTEDAVGQSREICGVHWASDIESGRAIGAATVARLHANPVFGAQLEAARAEVAKARNRGAVPAGNCSPEAATIATTSSLAP